VEGKTNIVYNCLDRHVKTWQRNKLALIWEGEDGDLRTLSYHSLNREVCKFANVLRSMGVKKGDRATICPVVTSSDGADACLPTPACGVYAW
jgi:acetyl-CoA synthetase